MKFPGAVDVMRKGAGYLVRIYYDGKCPRPKACMYNTLGKLASLF